MALRVRLANSATQCLGMKFAWPFWLLLQSTLLLSDVITTPRMAIAELLQSTLLLSDVITPPRMAIAESHKHAVTPNPSTPLLKLAIGCSNKPDDPKSEGFMGLHGMRVCMCTYTHNQSVLEAY